MLRTTVKDENMGLEAVRLGEIRKGKPSRALE